MRARGTREATACRLLAAVLAAASAAGPQVALGATPATTDTPPTPAVPSSPPPEASATPPAAATAPEPPVPVIHFVAGPRAVVGDAVTLYASASSDASGAIRVYRWIVEGERTPPTTTIHPVLVHRFGRAGRVRVILQVIDDHGREAEASAWLTVSARTPEPPRAPVAARRAKTHAARARATARAASAGGGTVTIKDFSFGPATITVHVGDTVTWPNQGPTDHTATANDGSFNTGILHKGQSGSHRFGSAGTFKYICSLHPFMKGTVNVVATASSGSGSDSSSSSGAGTGGQTSSAGPPSASAPASTGPTLANTGRDPVPPGVLGLVLLGLGIALRRRTAVTGCRARGGTEPG